MPTVSNRKGTGSETIYSQFNHLIKKIDNKIYQSKCKPLVSKLFYYLPVKKNRICCCNFAGKGYGDNPKYIAEEIHLRDSSYQLFWLVNDKSKSEFPEYIHTVNINSVKALYIRATSKIWINNIRNDHPVRKKKSQLYLQTWHAAGLGWKRVEADAEERLNKGYVAQAKHDGQITDGILACGKRQEELFKRAFWLNEKAEILKYGLPKNDYLVNNVNNTKTYSVLRKKYGLEEHVFYVLYAPTFRDDHSLEGYKLSFDEIIKTLKNKLQKEVKIVVRLHPNVSFQSKFLKYNKSIINGTFFPDVQELSLACDCLITDYSSIAADFLLMHKPVFICALDLQEYMEKRGLLPAYFDSPFPMTQTNEQLIASIKQFNIKEYIRKADEWFLKNPLYDDGHAAEKTVQWIFARVRKK